MKDFQKSRLALLQEIHGFFSDVVVKLKDTRHGSPQEKREYRRLGIIRRELNEWIDEVIVNGRLEAKSRGILSRE